MEGKGRLGGFIGAVALAFAIAVFTPLGHKVALWIEDKLSPTQATCPDLSGPWHYDAQGQYVSVTLNQTACKVTGRIDTGQWFHELSATYKNGSFAGKMHKGANGICASDLDLTIKPEDKDSITMTTTGNDCKNKPSGPPGHWTRG